MARITVEDCLKQIPNRFDLVLVASRRTRQLLDGRYDALVHWGNDKATVVALREIASGKVNLEMIESLERPDPMIATGDESV